MLHLNDIVTTIARRRFWWAVVLPIAQKNNARLIQQLEWLESGRGIQYTAFGVVRKGIFIIQIHETHNLKENLALS